MKRIVPFLLLSSSLAIAGFFPINKGMVNQGTYGTNAGTTTTLVASSNQVHVRDGIIFQILKLPNATLLPNDWWYEVLNNASSYVTVQDSSGANIASVNAGRIGKFYLKDNSIAAGVWKANTAVSDTDLSNYFAKTDFINITTGPTDAGKPVKTDASGLLSPTLIPGLGSTIGPSAGGTGTSTVPVAGSVLIGTSGGIYAVGVVSGSNNGITVTGSSGSIVISNQQDLRVTGSPSFTGLTLSGLSTGFVSNSNGVINTAAIPLGGSSVTGILPASKGGLGIGAAPGAGQIPVGNGIDYAPQTVSGSSNGITVTASPGGIAISHSQDLRSIASPTFNNGLFTGSVTASTFVAGVGTLLNPSLSIPTGSGNAGVYFGINGMTLAYNSADVLGWNSNILKSLVPIQSFYTSDASNPALYLLSDTTTGIFRSAANQWGWTSNGTKILDFSASGLNVTGTVTGSTGRFTDLTSNGVVTASSNGTLGTIAPGTSGNVLTSNGTIWTSAAAAGGSSTPYVYQAYHDNTCNWSRSAAAFGDPDSADATCAFVTSGQPNTNNFITASGTCFNSTGALPCIKVTPSVSGVVEICAQTPIQNNTANRGTYSRLMENGLRSMNEAQSHIFTAADFSMHKLCGFSTVTASQSVSWSIQMGDDASTTTIGANSGIRDSIMWWIKVFK